MKAILAFVGVMVMWLVLLMVAAVVTLVAVMGWVLLIVFIFGGFAAVIAAGVAASRRSQAATAQYYAGYAYPAVHTPHAYSEYVWHPRWGWVAVPVPAVGPVAVVDANSRAPVADSGWRQRRQPSALAAVAMRHGAPR